MTPTRSRFGGFSAAAVFALIGGMSGLGIALAVASLQGDTDSHIADLSNDLNERVAAGRAVIGVADDLRKAAETQRQQVHRAHQERARAEAFARTAAVGARIWSQVAADTASGKPVGGALEALALEPGSAVVDVRDNRIALFAGAGLTVGSTLSDALPVLARALATPRDSGFISVDAGRSWAVGPVVAGRWHVLSAVAVVPETPIDPGVDQALSAAVALASPVAERPVGGRSSGTLPLTLSLLIALAAAIIAAVYGSKRISGPIEATRAAADRYLHGDEDARADPEQGGPEARAVARAMNALLGRARDGREAGAAEHASGVRAMSAALVSLGHGELCTRAPQLPDGLQPLATGFDSARDGIRQRVVAIHSLSGEVAIAVAGVSAGAHKLRRASGDQVDVMKKLCSEAAETATGLAAVSASLGTDLDELGVFAAAQRKAGQQLRAGLGIAARRASDLWLSAGQLETSLQGMRTLEESVDLLEILATGSGEDMQVIRARAAACARRSREANEHLKREIGTLREDMEDVAGSLDVLQNEQEAPLVDLDPTVTTSLHEISLAFVRSAENLLAALAALDRGARSMQASAEQVFDGAEKAAYLGPRLDAALTDLDLGAHVESDLIDRLEVARQGFEAASARDSCTPHAQEMVADVVQAADEARVRIARLIAATEATADTLRNS